MNGRDIAQFLFRMGVIFCVLQLSWPVLGPLYEGAFRGVASFVFARDDSAREVSFRAHKTRAGDTRADIVNRKLMAADGSGPVREMDFGIRAMGWNPTTLLCALVLASPIAWGRRWRAFAVGVLVLQLFVLAILGMSLWLESSHVGLVDWSPTWQEYVAKLRQVLVDATRLAVPVLLWVGLVFSDRIVAERRMTA